MIIDTDFKYTGTKEGCRSLLLLLKRLGIRILYFGQHRDKKKNLSKCFIIFENGHLFSCIDYTITDWFKNIYKEV